MMINNPVTSMRLVDLLDMHSDISSFKFEDLYGIVGEWLQTEKSELVSGTLYNDFIKTFCDRYYSRNLNFDTFLDFKIKLRDCLRNNKEKARRMFEAGLIEINPLNTYKHETEHTGDKSVSTESNSNTRTDSEYSSDNDTNKKYKDVHDHYMLHSDTPSDTHDLRNMVDPDNPSTNYVTNVDNTKDTTVNESIIDHSKNTGNDSSNTTAGSTGSYKDDIHFKELQEGYDGHPADLIEKYINLNLDVVNFYMDCIEKACLFSSILY